MPRRTHLRFIELWIWLAALAGLAGWSLSALGQLNRAGYLCFFAVAAAIFLVCNRGLKWPVLNWRFFSHRLRRSLPAAFAVLALVVLAGSIFYAPTNYTGLNYHLGRVMQWTAAGHWWWIHTPVVRMNFSGCAFEWLTTPLVLFTQTDRALFLLNFTSLLLVPGLVFSVFTRLGVRAKVAWHWMWLLPTGYTFLLQGGSIDNDVFGSVFALAAVDFGCRAWQSRRSSDLWLSMLAIALTTGTKPTSLPLLLPWVVLVLPLFPLLRGNWLPTAAVTVLALIASFLPICLMNVLHTGDWLGRSVEPVKLEVHQPLIGILGNAYQLVIGNFAPTVFPLAGWWNHHAEFLADHVWGGIFRHNFDPGFILVGEVPTEDWAGLGFGISFLLAASVLGSLWRRGTPAPAPANRGVPAWLCRCVMVAAWVSLVAYSMKSGMANAARFATPYYGLLVPMLLLGSGHLRVIRTVWWRVLAGISLALALVALTLSPDRPLWPAKIILSKVLAQHPGQHSVERALKVYTIYSQRNDALAGVRQLLPPGLKVVGFIGDGDDCDISVWRPFGTRRVEHFLVTDPPDAIRSQVQYVVVGGFNLAYYHMTIDTWLKANAAELVATTNATVKISEGPQPWYLTRFSH